MALLTVGPAAAGTKRTLPDYSSSDAKMTVEMCANTCFSKGFDWAGTEYANECYCGRAGISNGATVAPGGDTDCAMRCAGDKAEFCGAGSRLTVYQGSTGSKRLSRSDVMGWNDVSL